MKLITKAIMSKLVKNGLTEGDHKPELKLFTPWGAATWLISEIGVDGETAFGLCDLGFGTPELGYVSISELTSVKGPFGLKVERDRHFTPTKTLSEYAEEARNNGAIRA